MVSLTDKKIEELKVTANEVRKSIIRMLVEAKSGHTAGSLDMADVFTYFYFHALRHDPKNTTWEERDRVILSNGHIAPVLYACMAHAGYMPVEELQTLRKFGSRLQGHPHREFMPWLETSSGPLGEGLSQAVGMAIADRINNKDTEKFIYCFLGDGELNEGNNWEAIMLAGKLKLNKLISVVDRNFIQIDGLTEDIMPLEPFKEKWETFNWHVILADGHDFKSLNTALEEAQKIKDKPIVILARTIPSKGVKEWEGDYKWHGRPPTKEEGEMALKELEKNI